MMDAANGLTSIISIIAVFGAVVLVVLLLREVTCWYFKINEHMQVMRDVLAELRRLRGQPSDVRPGNASAPQG